MPKTALITGAHGNLGQAVSRRFLQDGWKIVSAVRPGQKAAIEHDNLTNIEADLINEESAIKMVRTAINMQRTIDAAILLVGGFAMGNIQATDKDSLNKMYRLNFETAYFCARPVFKQMCSQVTGGRIVLVGTRPGLLPSLGKEMVAYTLSKSLIFALAEILNADGNDKNVITYVVVPGTIDTPQNRAAMPKADPGKWVKPESLANVIAFACSDDARDLREPILKIYGNS